MVPSLGRGGYWNIQTCVCVTTFLLANTVVVFVGFHLSEAGFGAGMGNNFT